MTAAEHIRRFVISRYIEPTRVKGQEDVRIRLGDIRREIGHTGPLQSIRSALSTRLFQDEAGVEPIEAIGPRAGADTYCHFRIHKSRSK